MSSQASPTPARSERASSGNTERSAPPTRADLLSWELLRRLLLERAEKLTPPPPRTPSEWANKQRVLPPGSAEPGEYRAERTPYCVPIGNACQDHRYRKVGVVMGTQMGKTSGLFNVIGQKLDDDPAPVLYIGPTRSNIDKVIEPQLMHMVREAASLRGKYDGRKPSKHLKKIAGVSLRLAWAGSPTELASQPAHTVLADEVDRMDPIPGEGDPLTLAEARIATYPDGRLIATSSPTEGTVATSTHPETGVEHWEVADPDDISSAMWRFWQEGTRYEWAVPCPHCHEFFVPRFRLLTWAENSTPRQAEREARLTHPGCGALIGNEHKEQLNARGTYLAPGQKVVGYDGTQPGRPYHAWLDFGDHNGTVEGDPPDSDAATFWVSGLMSPWVTFGRRAAAWLRAVRSGDQEQIRGVLNTGFGELYHTRGESPEWTTIRDGCRAEYKLGDVPTDVQYIFLTVDVQKDRMVYAIRGWGAHFESWLLAREELWGETDQPEVYSKLDAVVREVVGDKPIRAVAIDSGYRTDHVYEWGRRHTGSAVYVTKGRDRATKLYHASDVEVTRQGKKVRSGLKLWVIDDKHFKGWVHDRVAWPQDQAGAWHVPSDIDEDYCRQIVAEQRMRLPSGRVQWIKAGKNNHYLDCEALQAFLAHVEGVRNLRPLSGAPAPPPKKWTPRVVRSSYMGRS